MNSLEVKRMVEELRKKPALLGAVLILFTLLVYSSVAQHQFLEFDDSQYVTTNIHVSTGLSPGNIAWAFTTFHQGNWHPVTWLSHMADCSLFGLNSGPLHLVNVALHATNTVLLFFLLQHAAGAVWRSFLVALLFAVHPLNVETVAWVAERKSLLCTLFSLLTLAAYGWYVRRTGWRPYLAMVAAFALALMSKPMAVSLPLAMLLFDYWPLRRDETLHGARRWLTLCWEKVPLLLMSAASCVVTVIAQHSGDTVAGTSELGIWYRVGNAIVSYAAYIHKLVWPSDLAIFYPHPLGSLPLWKVIASVGVLAAATWAVLRYRRFRYLPVGWFFFVVSLVPVIGVVQVGMQAMADRYAYIPCLGLFIITAWGLGELAALQPAARFAPAVLAACMLVAYSMVTVNDLQYWQDGVQLFTRAGDVADEPHYAIEELLADAFLSAGRLDDAFQHYRKACELNPKLSDCHYNMAVILYHGPAEEPDRHRLQEALEQYRLAGKFANKGSAIELSCMINSAEIWMTLGNDRKANAFLLEALRRDPGNIEALSLRQRLLSQKPGENGQQSYVPPQ